jgi:hypothetical protein
MSLAGALLAGVVTPVEWSSYSRVFLDWRRPIVEVVKSNHTLLAQIKGDFLDALVLVVDPLLAQSTDVIVLESVRLLPAASRVEPIFCFKVMLPPPVSVNKSSQTGIVAPPAPAPVFVSRFGPPGCTLVGYQRQFTRVLYMNDRQQFVPVGIDRICRVFAIARFLTHMQWLTHLERQASRLLDLKELPMLGSGAKPMYNVDKVVAHVHSGKTMTDITWTPGQTPKDIQLNGVTWFSLCDELAERVLLFLSGGVPVFHIGYLDTGRFDRMHNALIKQPQPLFSRM